MSQLDLTSYKIAAVHHDSDPIQIVNTTKHNKSNAIPVKQPHAHSLSLTFSRDATLLFSGQSDSSLLLYNTKTSKNVNCFRQLELGISLIEPTHHKYALVCSPARKHSSKHHNNMTKVMAQRLYCWDIFNNQIVGYLKGHTSDIQSMHACLSDESLVSTDVTGNVKLWDLRQGTTCIGSSHTGANVPCAATFNSDGTLLAIAGVDDNNRPQVNVFDRRQLENGPIVTTYHDVWDQKTQKPPKKSVTNSTLSQQTNGHYSMNGFSRIKFSLDNEMILVTPVEKHDSGYENRKWSVRPPLHTVLSRSSSSSSTNVDSNMYMVVDDLGDKKTDHNVQNGPRLTRPEGIFSPDSKHILYGDGKRCIQVWKKLNKQEETIEKSLRQNVHQQEEKEDEEDEDMEGNDTNEAVQERSLLGPLKKNGLCQIASWSGHLNDIGPIRWSPKTELVCSGGGNLLMWLPKKKEKK